MRKISAFIRKMVEILSNSDNYKIISWNAEGTGFQIHSPTRFSEKTLPAYFKHSNMASFVRQLNMYGFTRLRDSEQHSYHHPDFLRGEPEKYKLIKRKSPSSKPYSEESEPASDRGSEPEGSKKLRQDKSEWEALCHKLKQENKLLKSENERLIEKIQQYETLRENMNKFCLERAMWVEKNRNGGSTQTDNSSNRGDPTNSQKKNSSADEESQNKRQSCVLVLQHPKRAP